MPFINIATSQGTLSASQKQQLFNQTTRLMSEVMHKNPTLTSIRIDEYPATNWAVDQQSMQARNQTAVHMDIKVTAGTNTDQEKAEMISQGMSMLKGVIGNIPEASYIVIHEIDAEAWGYGGQTQAARAQKK
jgi:4-oxalocrotonate tautomerase